jgi:hypothetical protein
LASGAALASGGQLNILTRRTGNALETALLFDAAGSAGVIRNALEQGLAEAVGAKLLPQSLAPVFSAVAVRVISQGHPPFSVTYLSMSSSFQAARRASVPRISERIFGDHGVDGRLVEADLLDCVVDTDRSHFRPRPRAIVSMIRVSLCRVATEQQYAS